MKRMVRLYTSTKPFLLKGNSVGVLLIHGFSSSPAEMRGLGDYLHGEGYTVLAVRLKGHGTNLEDMKASSLQDWLQSVEVGYKKLQQQCKQVFIVGFSMGSLLAVEVGSRVATAGVVVMAPPMVNLSILRWLIPMVKWVKPYYVIAGGLDPSVYEPPYTVKAYPKVPMRCVGEFARLLRMIRGGKIIKAPLLVMQGMKDSSTPVDSGEKLLEVVKATETKLIHFENSGHVLPVGVELKEVWKAVGRFVKYQIDRTKEN